MIRLHSAKPGTAQQKNAVNGIENNRGRPALGAILTKSPSFGRHSYSALFLFCQPDALRSWGMATPARVLAALKRAGWVETRRLSSHRVLVKGNEQRIWAYHDGADLGGPAMARIARDSGYTLDELRKL